MHSERRRNRSNIRDEAARLYLGGVAARNGMRAVAVADMHGLLVVGAGEPDVLERLAAAGAAEPADDGPWPEMVREISKGSVFSSSPLEIGGAPFCLAVLGGTGVPDAEISAALNRILLS